MLLGAELDQITDIEAFEKADLDMQATPNMMVQCVLVDGREDAPTSGSSPTACRTWPSVPHHERAGLDLLRTYDIVQRRLEDFYLQVRLMRLEVKRPPEAPCRPRHVARARPKEAFGARR